MLDSGAVSIETLPSDLRGHTFTHVPKLLSNLSSVGYMWRACWLPGKWSAVLPFIKVTGTASAGKHVHEVSSMRYLAESVQVPFVLVRMVIRENMQYSLTLQTHICMYAQM